MINRLYVISNSNLKVLNLKVLNLKFKILLYTKLKNNI
jgi:hypothetical protein